MPATRRLGPAAITLIVIDVLLIGVLIFLLATAPDGPDAARGDDPSSASSGSSEPAAGDGGTSSTSTQAVTAPANAVDLSEFVTPSGNIWCTLTDSEATCQIDEIDYQPPQIDGCEDNALAGKVIQVGAEGAEYPCATGDIAGAAAGDRTVLEYDQTTAFGDSMCVSTDEGVTCTNLSTGARFTITRYGPSLD